MNLIDHRPKAGDSLYEFHFKHLAKIDKSRLNFSEADKVSLIVGAINNSTITAAIEAGGITDPNVLGVYLKNKIHEKNKTLIQHTEKFANQAGPSNYNNKHTNIKKSVICTCCGFTGHYRSSCRHVSKSCNFCKMKGHIERNCYKKPTQNEHNTSEYERDDRKKNIKESTNEEKVHVINDDQTKTSCKFHKDIYINNKKINSFIDFGSSCSIIKKHVAQKLNLPIKPLEKSISLSGFLGISTIINSYTTVVTKIDNVALEINLYIISDNNLSTDILIGRNFTEHERIVYYRIDDTLTFKYKTDCTSWIKNLKHGELFSRDKMELHKILENHKSCIYENLNKLGKAHNVSLSIELTTNKPVTHRAYRISEADKSIIRDKIKELRDANIIRESTSPYASPALLVTKKDGNKRLVIDYRALNKITVKNKFPMPLIAEIIQNLSDYKYFTSIDLASGYHQIPMDEKSIPLTAFITPEGLYEYIRVPFGLSNAPAIFQQFMNTILQPFKQYDVVPYLDDILIPSKNISSGLKLLDDILNVMIEYGLTINMHKSLFLVQNINYLGYEISENLISPSQNKTQAVNNFPYPQNQHQLRQFLGLTGYFRKFIEDYARITAPLTNLLKKDSNWEWPNECSKIVDDLKNKICAKPILTLFNPELPTIVYTDASRDGYAGILIQKHENKEKPVAFFSKQTIEAEKNYHSFELELLAIVKTLDKFKPYLIGKEFTIITDCNAVKNALNKQTRFIKSQTRDENGWYPKIVVGKYLK